MKKLVYRLKGWAAIEQKWQELSRFVLVVGGAPPLFTHEGSSYWVTELRRTFERFGADPEVTIEMTLKRA